MLELFRFRRTLKLRRDCCVSMDGDSRRSVLDANTIRQVLANPNIHAMEVVDRTVSEGGSL